MTPDEFSTLRRANLLEHRAKNKRIRSEAAKAKRREKQKYDVKNLTDDYVKELLKREFKGIEIPTEIIDVKRAVIVIKREQRRLKETVKTCKKHGKLTIKQLNVTGKLASGEPAYKCKQCQKELHIKHYLQHKERVAEKHRQYRLENPERVKEIKKISKQKNPEAYKRAAKNYLEMQKTVNYKEYRRRENIRKNRNRHNLTDGYMRRLLREKTGIPLADITDEMIEAKRMQVRIKRSQAKLNVEDKIHSIDMNLVQLKRG